MNWRLRITQHWQAPRLWLTLLLAPLTGLYRLVSGIRKLAYRTHLRARVRLPVPVVIIGNINVGGVGKTPLTLALVDALRQRGYTPGIISRGYGGSVRQATRVTAQHSPHEVGDEPLLLIASGAPVVVCRDRPAAALALLAQAPEVDVILSDDGLQHERLARDIELVVLDGSRGLGNGRCLPNGPLRENRARLAHVDALIINGTATHASLVQNGPCPVFHMHLQPGDCYHLGHPEERRPISHFRDLDCAALAGIGHPERFFATLTALGIHARCYPFPDHHLFQAQDIPEAQAVLVTSKDAVKLAAYNNGTLWVLPVAAQVHPDLGGWLANRLHEITNGQ